MLDSHVQLVVSALHRTALAPGIKKPTMNSRSLFLWSLPTSGKIQKTTEIINRGGGGTILNALKQTKTVDELEKAEGQECSADVTFNLRPDGVGSRRAMMKSCWADQSALTTNPGHKEACMLKQQQQNGEIRAKGTVMVRVSMEYG